jgi:phosphatidylserine/phosphatidylglycerophosphate/cardiolipin synthase-like enzyme
VTFLATVTRRGRMFLLVTALLMAVVPSTAAARQHHPAKRVAVYTPVTGPVFNRPVGTAAQQMAIFTHINNTISSAPKGSTIRIAVFSFGLKSTADRLIAADKRGVHVQLIFDDHSGAYAQVKRLVRALGKNRASKSFVVLCSRSCRGTSGNMHSKFFLFTRAGNARNVVMVGSDNVTRHNAEDQWSDVYTVVGDKGLMNTFTSVFTQMIPDAPVADPYFAATNDAYQSQFYPYPRVAMDQDPVYEALSQVTCVGATDRTGDKVETVVDPGVPGDPSYPPVTETQHVTRLRISMHAWNGTRGRYLAEKVIELFQEGCHIRAALGIGTGSWVKSALVNAGVPVTTGTHKSIRTHEKYLLLSGVYAGNTGSRIVWTGSHNWSNGSLNRDEVIFRVDGPLALHGYQKNFKDVWNNG